MSDPIDSPPAPPTLQFDRAITTAEADAVERSSSVLCSQCKRPIAQSYFTLAEEPFCGRCKLSVDESVARTRTPAAFGRACLFGIGAAVAGAIVYYAVIALLDLEIGIVAILIGYMVGYAIRHAARGGGGRRYQILGAALTYFAVGLAYMPVVIKAARDGEKTSATTAMDSSKALSQSAGADSANVASTDSTARDKAGTTDVGRAAPAPARKRHSFLAASGILVFFAFALPILSITGSMPSGLISAVIIVLGMRQAWRMTAESKLTFIGPLKVAPPRDPAMDASAAAPST